MKAKHKRLLIGVVSLAACDFAGVIAMVLDPDITARAIPCACWGTDSGVRCDCGDHRDRKTRGGTPQQWSLIERLKRVGQQWVPWLFGFLALLSFLRVGLALLYIAGEEGHRHSWFSPIAGAVMGGFFLWLAVLARRSASSGESKAKATWPGFRAVNRFNVRCIVKPLSQKNEQRQRQLRGFFAALRMTRERGRCGGSPFRSLREQNDNQTQQQRRRF